MKTMTPHTTPDTTSSTSTSTNNPDDTPDDRGENPPSNKHVTRRTALQTTGAIMGTAALISTTGTGAASGTERVTLEVRDQETDGEHVRVDRAVIRTDYPVNLVVFTDGETRGNQELDPGEHDNIDIRLPEPFTESQHVSVRAYPGRDAPDDVAQERIARVDASMHVGSNGRELISEIEPRLIRPSDDDAHNYPYFMYAPARYDDDTVMPVLVEPANSGRVNDDFDVHLDAGERLITGSMSRRVASELNAPFIVPVFPRSETDPVSARHYPHALDDTVLGVADGPMERIDLQVLSMIEDAQHRLVDAGYPVRDGAMLNGFSASGNFVDRFTVLHADRVTSVTAGGLNGMPLLPVREVDGRELPFHVGIADVEDLTGEPVDVDAVDETPQFLYMGAEDENDTAIAEIDDDGNIRRYTDAWTSEDLHELALDVYGEDMIEDRFPRSEAVYEDAGVDATFKVYEGAGHTPRPAFDDIVEFHREAVEESSGVVTTVEERAGRTGEGGVVEFVLGRVWDAVDVYTSAVRRFWRWVLPG